MGPTILGTVDGVTGAARVSPGDGLARGDRVGEVNLREARRRRGRAYGLGYGFLQFGASGHRDGGRVAYGSEFGLFDGRAGYDHRHDGDDGHHESRYVHSWSSYPQRVFMNFGHIVAVLSREGQRETIGCKNHRIV